MPPPARAVPVVTPNCVEQFWMLVLRASTRRICDGPIRPDGSWHRCRLFYAPDYVIPAHVYCSGGRYSTYCIYYPPQYVPELNQSECYEVTPDTVQPDEPGHLL
ncbi:CDGP domain-containing protein [Mycobacterium sp. THU-M104]|uniref:CDGP domain-containing protein n=1 Tax=Mycobacterium sp. THU-M104 TaxID=3410515 RepID=UPI003B99AD07